MMRKINKLMLLILMLFIPTFGINADVEENINAGSGAFSGGGGNCTDEACWPSPNGSSNSTRGMRVSLINGKGTQKCSKDFVFNSSDVASNLNGKTFITSSSWGNKISYKNGLSLSKGTHKVKVSYYNLANYTSFFSVGTTGYDGDVLIKNLNANNYKNLRSVISGLGCSYDYNNDFIVIEPLTVVKSDGKLYYGTIYELARMLGSKSGLRNLFSSMANTLNLSTSQFGFSTNQRCDSNTLPGCVTNKTYQGMGLYKISDVLPQPPSTSADLTIRKVQKIDDNPEHDSPVCGVTFRVVAGGKTYESTTKGKDCVATFEELPLLATGQTHRIIELNEPGYDMSKATLYWDDYGGGNRVMHGYATENGNVIGVYWDINTLESNRILTIKNEKTCISEFNTIDKNNLSERLRLYNTYKSEDNQKLNGLLNLGNDKAEDACRHYSCNQSLTSGCLALENQSTNNNDFSCYDFNVSVPGNNAQIYCFSNFSLQNLFSGSPSKGNYQFGFGNYTIKSGRLINADKNKKEAAELNLDIYCYSTKDVGSSLNIGKTYSNFISSVSFKNKTLGYTNKNEAIELTTKSSQYGGYIYSLNSKSIFTYPMVYAHRLSGKIEYDLDVNSAKNYSFMGYGIKSELTDKTDEIIDIEYTVSLGSAVTGKDIYKEENDYSDGSKYADGKYSNNKSCVYKVDNDITEQTPDGNNTPSSHKLNLEFRVIDATTTDSKIIFPGITGNGRKIGANWCKNLTSCSSAKRQNDTNEINLEPIIDGVNSYGYIPSDSGKDKQTAKYTIELNASDIKAIREYNKEVKYDEFDLECDVDGSCVSDLLEDMRNQIIKTPSGKTFNISNKLIG